MANLSDCWGKISVEKVGKEFVEFLNEVQKDAYYVIADAEHYKDAEIDKEGNLVFDFSSFGRWNYSRNLEGYLTGEWMSPGEQKDAYDKLVAALIAKDGAITVEYKDCDPGCEWLGEGVYTVEVDNGEVVFNDNFEEGDFTIKNFAEFQMETEDWALEYIYGDEVADKYYAYVEEWKKTHNFVEGREEPASPDEWYNNEYQEE